MMQISFDEFKKLDIRTAKVLKVEDHPNADKLYLVTVDMGGGGESALQKTLVAGIKGHYAKDDLIGRTVIVLDNLQPAVIRGVESQGMILAAGDNGRKKLVVLTTEKPIEPGCKIS